MNAWEALVRQALVGNNVRNEHAFALLEQLQEHGFTIDADQSPERRLLQAAALQQHLHAAASQPTTPNKVLRSVAPTETHAYCSSLRITQLRSILRYKHDEILIEWLVAIADAQEVLLPELLPELLAYCSKRVALQPYVLPVLGARGQWLAPLNPDWHYAQQWSDQTEEPFLHGERDTRLQYLQQLAQQQPSAALKLVQQVWAEEGHDLRAAFLGIFIPLPPMEKALDFWEQAAQDGRQTVRQQATRLLRRFPQASLIQRLQARLETWMVWSDQEQLPTVQLPEGMDAALRKDGIVEQRTWVANQGLRANILAQVIATVPPQWWTDTYPWSRSEWVRWATESEWAAVFMTGWAKAAQTFEAADWLLDCQAWFFQKALRNQINTASFEFLYDNLPNTLFQQLAAQAVDLEPPRPFTDAHPLFTVLLIEGQAWTAAFSAAVLQRIQLTIKRESYVFHWTLKAVLKRAAYAIPAELHELAKEGWPTDSAAWPSWQKEVQELLSLLQFRESVQRGV